jgi:PTS system mannose-specific IID component
VNPASAEEHPVPDGSAPSPGPAVLASMFLRSLTIQGSWNYRTMIGGGFAFSLLPLLRRLRGERHAEIEAALARHSAHFNSHPYLVGIGLGAVARLEMQDEPPEVMDRFKAAVRGPLGSIGDTLVWTGWLPATLLVALCAGWWGISRGGAGGLVPWGPVVLFLALYNAGHLGLRAWAFRVGLQEGVRVGARLRDASLRHRTEIVLRSGSLLVGALLGLMLVSPGALGDAGAPWPALALVAFAVGLTGGFRIWRPTALAIVALIVLIFLTRVVS